MDEATSQKRWHESRTVNVRGVGQEVTEMNYVPKIGMASGCGKSLEKGTVLFMLVRSGLSALSEG